MSDVGNSPISHDCISGNFPLAILRRQPAFSEGGWEAGCLPPEPLGKFFYKMKLTTAIALLLTCVSVLARDLRWRVQYSGGTGRDAIALIKEGKVSIVPAKSAAQARRDVMKMFPGAIVTSVSEIK
jgi:hypothetical protein